MMCAVAKKCGVGASYWHTSWPEGDNCANSAVFGRNKSISLFSERPFPIACREAENAVGRFHREAVHLRGEESKIHLLQQTMEAGWTGKLRHFGYRSSGRCGASGKCFRAFCARVMDLSRVFESLGCQWVLFCGGWIDGDSSSTKKKKKLSDEFLGHEWKKLKVSLCRVHVSATVEVFFEELFLKRGSEFHGTWGWKSVQFGVTILDFIFHFYSEISKSCNSHFNGSITDER